MIYHYLLQFAVYIMSLLLILHVLGNLLIQSVIEANAFPSLSFYASWAARKCMDRLPEPKRATMRMLLVMATFIAFIAFLLSSTI